MQNHSSNSSSASGNEHHARPQNLSAEARSRGGQNSPGNFKNDPERAAELGRKGGSASRGRREDADEE